MERKRVQGGFITDEGTLPGLYYVLTEPWRTEFAAVFANERAEFIRLNRALGWRCAPLDFLLDLEKLRGVEVYHWDITDLSPLRRLPHLEFLGLECRFAREDFASSFPNLRAASVTWRPGCDTLFSCVQLEYLSFSKYPYPDLSPLRGLDSLVRLFVNSGKLLATDGLGHRSTLRNLTFSYCTKLHSVEGISQLNNLEQLQLATCKQVHSLAPIGKLKNLRRLIVENSGEIESVKPLAGCADLEELFLIGTKVSDGDLTPLLQLKNLRKVAIAKSSRHSHTTEQLNAILSTNTRTDLPI